MGINFSDDVFDLIYAIYQGVAFAHLMHLENLKKGGVIRKCAVLSGGASNSHLWCQVFADVPEHKKFRLYLQKKLVLKELQFQY